MQYLDPCTNFFIRGTFSAMKSFYKTFVSGLNFCVALQVMGCQDRGMQNL